MKIEYEENNVVVFDDKAIINFNYVSAVTMESKTLYIYVNGVPNPYIFELEWGNVEYHFNQFKARMGGNRQ